MAALGKALILIGFAVFVIGLLLWGGASIPIFDRLGRLPGDFYVHRSNFSFYFPLTTSIIISVGLSLLFLLMRR